MSSVVTSYEVCDSDVTPSQCRVFRCVLRSNDDKTSHKVGGTEKHCSTFVILGRCFTKWD